MSQSKASESSYSLKFKHSKIGELNSDRTWRCARVLGWM